MASTAFNIRNAISSCQGELQHARFIGMWKEGRGATQRYERVKIVKDKM